MSDTPQHEAHRRPHTPPMADPFMEFDLSAEIHRLHAETTWNTGQNARTLIKYDDFRVVLIALAAEARMSEHKTDGRITIHVLSGHIQLRASGRTFNLRSGGCLRSTMASLTTSTHLKRAPSSLRLPGREEDDALGHHHGCHPCRRVCHRPRGAVEEHEAIRAAFIEPLCESAERPEEGSLHGKWSRSQSLKNPILALNPRWFRTTRQRRPWPPWPGPPRRRPAWRRATRTRRRLEWQGHRAQRGRSERTCSNRNNPRPWWQHDCEDRQQCPNGERRGGGKCGLQRTGGELVGQSKFIARMGTERIMSHQLLCDGQCEARLEAAPDIDGG